MQACERKQLGTLGDSGVVRGYHRTRPRPLHSAPAAARPQPRAARGQERTPLLPTSTSEPRRLLAGGGSGTVWRPLCVAAVSPRRPASPWRSVPAGLHHRPAPGGGVFNGADTPCVCFLRHLSAARHLSAVLRLCVCFAAP